MRRSRINVVKSNLGKAGYNSVDNAVKVTLPGFDITSPGSKEWIIGSENLNITILR